MSASVCNIFITPGVRLVLLALPIASSIKERVPCHKVTASSTNKETKQDTEVKIFNTGECWGVFFWTVSNLFFLFTVLDPDATDWDDRFNTSSSNWYSFSFHLCLAERASLHPYALFTQCPSFLHSHCYLSALFSFYAMISVHLFPHSQHLSVTLLLTSDFLPLWILCVSFLSSLLRSYV